MVRANRVRGASACRIIGDENPLEGLMRLKSAREREVGEKSEHEWNRLLLENLARPHIRLKNASIQFQASTDQAHPRNVVRLFSNGEEIAIADVRVFKRKDKVEAVIEEFQGRKPKEQMDVFRRNNGEYWNIFLVNAIKDATYEGGFDRVLLRDVTTTMNYLNPVGHEGQTVEGLRQQMKQLYTVTRKQCQFTKREVLGKPGPAGIEFAYFVREFP